MARLKDLQAFVTVNKRKLPEFEDADDEDPSPDKTSVYVEAVSDAEFEVVFEREKVYRHYGGTGLQFEVHLDGKNMDNVVLRGNPTDSYLNGVRKYQKGNWTLEKFKFSNILITETPSTSKDLKKLVDGLGVISVKVFRVQNIQQSKAENGRYNNPTASGLISQPISEKALKGQSLSMCGSLGAPEPTASMQPLKCEFMDTTSNPYAVFNFKYRSKKALQDMCIIRRSPSPVPLERRPKDQLTREELLELLNRRSATVKPETRPDDASRRGIKRERDQEYEELLASAITKKPRARHEIEEVIDLLDD